MNELIKVNNEGRVTARGLYEFLELASSQFARWVKTNIEQNEFYQEGIDWQGFDIMSSGNEIKDYHLTIDFAKHLCMLSRSERGKQARSYFIEVENRYKSAVQNFQVPQTLPGALRLAADLADKNEVLQLENAKQNQIIHELRPKASYYDFILQTNAAISVSQIAKDYGMSATKLNSLLHELKVQYKQGDTWLLYQDHSPMGYTTSKTHNYVNSINQQCSKLHTCWTQKGRLFIYDLLKQSGVLPLIERDGLRLVSEA